jgi:ferredoxin
MAAQRVDKKTRRRARRVRWIVLGVILVGVTAVVTAHQLVSGPGEWVGVDALCPFGGLETLFSLLTGSGFIKQTAASALILLIGMLVMALVYRRSFCGAICPLGTLQGIFGALGGKLFKHRPKVPRRLDAAARLIKYAVLALFAVWTWQAAELVMRPYDPWVAWAHLTSAELFTSYGIGFAILVVSLVGSLVYERFFCKYLCPTGALLGLLARFSVLRIRRDAAACTDCGTCDRVCMMNVRVATVDAVTSSECISCNECVNACPAAGALQVVAPSGKRIPSLVAVGVVVAVLVAIVGVTTATGAFDWQQPGLAAAASGGSFDTTQIKGSTSLAEIIAATDITAAEFTSEWGVPAGDLGKPMSEIKDQYGFTPEDVRAWVEARLAE